MNIAPAQSSPWMVDFHKQMIRCKHVLLYGNIADQFLLNGSYCSLPQFLRAYFSESGFEIIGSYDIVDSFQFAVPQMEQQFEQIVRAQLTNSPAAAAARQSAPPAPSPPAAATVPPSATTVPPPPVTGPLPGSPLASSPRTSGGAPPPRGIPSAGGPITAPAENGSGAFVDTAAVAATTSIPTRFGQTLRDPLQALAALRFTLRQPTTSAAMTLWFSDKLVGHADHQCEQERILLVHLMKALQEAAFLPAGKLAGRKNALVIVANQLGGLPEWLHKDNPFLEKIQIMRPQRDERRRFVQQFIRAFYHATPGSNGTNAELADDFANLTDGFSAWDLEAIRRTSLAEKIDIAQPKQLIDYYKYGLREDPWEKLDLTRIRQARQTLQQRVIGQDNALSAIESMLIAARIGVTFSGSHAVGGRPKGVFFFVGPTGVGKTELAKALTELIFSDESAFARFDMSEYAEKHAAEKLAGPPPGYVGYEEGGQLTNRVRTRPFSVLLFDEIEKAHPAVMDKFLQILEDGRLTDGKGQTAFFSHTVLIFTSNIGADTLEMRSADQQLASYEEIEQHFRSAVADHFRLKLGRPELLNRFGENILVFDLLRPEYIRGIFNKFMQALIHSAREQMNVELVFPDDSIQQQIVDLMMQGDNLLYGGRRIKMLLEKHVERPLNYWLFHHGSGVQRVELTAGDDQRSICISAGRKLDTVQAR